MNQEMYKLGTNRSVIREISEYARQRKQEIGKDQVFDFSIGNPSVEPPVAVKNGLIKLLETEDPVALHSYTQDVGDLEVRKQLIQHINQTFSVSESEDLLYLTSGASSSLAIVLKAICEKEDEVIIFSPYFPEYEVFVSEASAKMVICPTNPKTFVPEMEYLKNCITPLTKAVMVNSPNNPTGVYYTEEVIKNISRVLKEFEQLYGHPIYLISDEPYRELVYVNRPYPFITKYYQNSIVLYSYSKSLSLPGDRIGYILVSNQMEHKEDVFACIRGSGRYLGYICAPSMFQRLLPLCFGVTSDISIYHRNRDILVDNLKRIGYEMVTPEGAFYLFLKALEPDANAFLEVAKQFNLIFVPSDSFGIKGYVRISYCVSEDMIHRSILPFQKLYDSYQERKNIHE